VIATISECILIRDAALSNDGERGCDNNRILTAWSDIEALDIKPNGHLASFLKELMSKPERLHRFDKMSDLFHLAVQRIANQYSGDAARIWKGIPSSAEAVYSFLEFDGVGQKLATMAANLLARTFKIPFADYFPIDISADVHVRRFFSLHPIFPGIMDSPTWAFGRRHWNMRRRCSA